MARKITNKRVEQKTVLIAFEDSKSSKYYFNDFKWMVLVVKMALTIKSYAIY